MLVGLEYRTDFFTHLAELFYAIAISDKHFPRKEKEEIIRLVNTYWILKNENFSSRDIIYEKLRSLALKKVDKNDAFNAFKSFYLDHIELFPSEIKEKVMESAYSIANSYARRNKSEVILLHQLHTLLYTK